MRFGAPGAADRLARRRPSTRCSAAWLAEYGVSGREVAQYDRIDTGRDHDDARPPDQSTR